MRKWRFRLACSALLFCSVMFVMPGCGRKPPDVPPPMGEQVEAEINPDGSMEAGGDPEAE